MCKNNKSSAEESNVGIIDNSMRLAYTNYVNVERRPAYGNNYCRSSSSSGCRSCSQKYDPWQKGRKISSVRWRLQKLWWTLSLEKVHPPQKRGEQKRCQRYWTDWWIWRRKENNKKSGSRPDQDRQTGDTLSETEEYLFCYWENINLQYTP